MGTRDYDRSIVRLVLAMSVIAFLLAGCGGDGDVTVGDFEGSWEASSFTMTSAEDPEQSMDLVGLGASFLADVDAEGTIDGAVGIPAALGGPAELPLAATFVIEDQETLTVNFEPEIPPLLTSYTGPFELDGDTLTTTDENAVFDFGDGNPVAAIAVIVLQRTS